MKINNFLLSLGGLAIIGITGISIYYILTPTKTNCVDEITEITNASNIEMAIVMAPEKILEKIKPFVLPKTVTTPTNDIVVIAGSISHKNSSNTVFFKVLIDVNTSKDDVIFKEIDLSLHKQTHQCSLNKKNYQIYTGKTLIGAE